MVRMAMKVAAAITLLSCLVHLTIATTWTSSRRPATKSLPVAKAVLHHHEVITTTPPTRPLTTPSPFDLKFVVRKHDVDCIKFQGHISILVHQHHHHHHHHYHLEQSKCRTSVRSKCSSLKVNETAHLVVTCSNTGKKGAVVHTKLYMDFTGGIGWYMSSIQLKHNGSFAAASFRENVNVHRFSAPRNHSYTCAEDRKVELHGDGPNTTVEFGRVEVQPFYSGEVVRTSVCSPRGPGEGDHSSVPVAVGCALAVLIIVVFIAYIIGRKKEDRNYQKL